MKELVEFFVKNLERKEHIFELFNKVKLVLTIGNNQENCSVFINDGMVSMSPTDMGTSSIRVEIKGNTEAISSLLNGSLKLREGTIRNQLQVVGSFRHTLLLESVFYLAGKSGCEDFLKLSNNN
ncbi:MAG: hypothetical protein ACQEXB_16610 [Bacillota bacterium]